MIDDSNFFILEKQNDEFLGNQAQQYYAILHRRVDSTGNHCINGSFFLYVCSGISHVVRKKDGPRFRNLIEWTSIFDYNMNIKKRLLYNCETGKLMVHEFTDIGFSKDCNDFLEVINKIDCGDSYIAELHFLVDDDGVIRSKICDIVSGDEYLLTDGFDNKDISITKQLELLDAIFNEVRDKLKKKHSSVLNILKHKKDN